MLTIIKRYRAKQVMEGGGVLVNRLFGHGDTEAFDPFLMLDFFELPKSDMTSPGFPWHPHRGMETITYMIQGSGLHEDSLGNKGIIGPGELQWMSAAKGILHQEMPAHSPDGAKGIQFWVNLPAKEKMKDPSYAYIRQGEMHYVKERGLEVRVIAGEYNQKVGPIDKSAQGITMLHILLESGRHIELNRDDDKQGFVFLMSGKGSVNDEEIEGLSAYTLAPGRINITANEDLEFIFAQGTPLNEPIAWQGPIVMNTREELIEAFKDLDNGTFI